MCSFRKEVSESGRVRNVEDGDDGKEWEEEVNGCGTLVVYLVESVGDEEQEALFSKHDGMADGPISDGCKVVANRNKREEGDGDGDQQIFAERRTSLAYLESNSYELMNINCNL